MDVSITLISSCGYHGSRWATVLSELVLGAVAWYLTRRHVGTVPVIPLTWRPVLAGLAMGVCVYPLSNLGGVAIVIPIAVGVAAYTIACVLVRAVTRDEIDFARRALNLSR